MEDSGIDIKPIPNFDGYFISTNGDVLCNLGKGNRRDTGENKTVPLYALKPRLTQNGYARVYMRNNKTNKRTDRYVHRLVAEAFLPNDEGKRYVNHKNCIRDDNSIDNLEWATAKENTDQTVELGHIIRDECGRYVSNFDYEMNCEEGINAESQE